MWLWSPRASVELDVPVETPIVTLSFVASGVNVTNVAADSSSVSVVVSAAIVVEPTLTLLNAFWLT